MAVSVRAHVAGNVAVNNVGGSASVTANKPNGLAVGDVWLIFHGRRSAAADTATPAGFTQLGGNGAMSSAISKIYYKVADAADVAGGAKAWTQSTTDRWQTISVAIVGADVGGTIFDAESPVDATDATSPYSVAGLTPNVDGITMVFAQNATVVCNWTAPTTQGGGWTEQADVMMDGGASASRMAQGIFYKARTAAQGATGAIDVVGSSTAQSTNVRAIHINEAGAALTRVTKDITLQWRQYTSVGKSIALQWRQYTSVGKSIELRWAVAAPITTKTTDVRLTFPQPPDDLIAGAGLQEFRIEARKVGSGPDPLLTAYLYENGTNLSTLLTNQAVPDASETFSATWNASLLTNINGSGVELRVVITGDSACYGELVDAEFNARHLPVETQRVSKDVTLQWRQLETVAKDAALQWATLSTVGKSVELRWATLTTVSKAIELRWVTQAPLTSVGKSVTLQWRVYTTVGKQVELRWAVLTTVGKSVTLQWRTLAPVGKSIELRWITQGATTTTGKSVTLQWRTLASVGKSIELRWVTNAPLTSVGKSVTLQWRTLASVGKSLELRWITYQSVGKSVALQWRTYGFVGKSIALQWRVYTTTGKSVALWWRVYTTTSKSIELRWRTEVAKTTDVRLTFQAPPGDLVAGAGLQEFRIEARKVGSGATTPLLTAYLFESATQKAQLLTNEQILDASETFSVTWDAALLTAISGAGVELRVVITGDTGAYGELVDVEWNATHLPTATERVAKDIELRWVTSGRIAKDAQLQWIVYQSVGKSIGLRWITYGFVGKSIELRWVTQSPIGTVSKDVTLQWRVYTTTGKSIALQWRTLQSVGKSIELRWAVLSAATTRVSKDIQLRWRTLQSVGKSIELAWVVNVLVLTRVSKDIQLRWITVGRIYRDIELRWRTLSTILEIYVEGRVKPKTYATGAVGSKIMAVWDAPLQIHAVGQLRPKVYAEGSVRPKVYAEGYVKPKITATQTPRPDIYAEGQLRPKIAATGRVRE